ncbi:MAG: hypothetical protein KJ950_01065 [Proteobacteria bacterium]|nr:hypothetical protein [Pseudomonadota bacterium]MBU1686247.1 hypothetical protein [Pseudomonadota bacterium]
MGDIPFNTHVYTMINVNKQSNQINYGTLFGVVFAIKWLIYLVDSNVQFFIGDSISYIHTARTGWIPEDRSFLYGFFIRWISSVSHSLSSVVGGQILLSGIVAVGLGFILKEYLSVRKGIALSFAIICALEPLQLMFERYVMTESICLAVFVLYLTMVLGYLKRPRFFAIVGISGLGVLLIAFRISFLPVVVIGAFLIPLLAAREKIQKLFFAAPGTAGEKRKIAWALGLHLVLMGGGTLGGLQGYQYLNGALSEKRPAFQYENGFFLIASWAPVLKKQDFPIQEEADAIFDNLPFDLKDYRFRESQRWLPDCLVGRIKARFKEPGRANQLSLETARNALKRDPLGVINLAWLTYRDFWISAQLDEALHWDRGERPLPKEFSTILLKDYSLNAEDFPQRKTLTNQYFFHAVPWYYIVLLLPVIVLLTLFSCREGQMMPLGYLGGVVGLLFLLSFGVVSKTVVRYLHPLAWCVLLFFGVLVNNYMILLEKYIRRVAMEQKS